jgi:hypothetical protein
VGVCLQAKKVSDLKKFNSRISLYAEIKLILFFLFFISPILVWAHGGGLNAEGCHNNRKTGDYHCHRTPAPKQVQNIQTPGQPTQREQPVCYTGPKGGTYTITPSGKKNYKGC